MDAKDWLSPFLYGMHDQCPPNVLDERGSSLRAVALGSNPTDMGTIDLSGLKETPIVRIQHGWGQEGTLPREPLMLSYLQRIRNFVSGSRGVHVWVAWNEPNHSQERPDGEIITPEYAASSYLSIREAIRTQDGHNDDLVLVGAVAPWNLETGDWLDYLRRVCVGIGSDADGFALHAYTHGSDPRLVFSDHTEHGWLWHFHVYRQTIREGIPAGLHDRPMLITETNQGDGPWVDANSGWVQNAYADVAEWNQSNPVINSLILYRWAFDKWRLNNKPGVLGDLRAAQAHGYTWTGDTAEPPEETMIQNPGLERPYRVQGDSNILVADGWRFGYNQPDHPSGARPELSEETRSTGEARVLQGNSAQKVFWTYAFGEAWLSQVVRGLEVGKWYEFSAHVYIWSSDEDNPNTAVRPGKVWARLGVHPWGSENANDRGVEFGGAVVDQYNKWLALSTVFQAKRSDVCVFLWGAPEHPAKHNDLYWDAVHLEEWECVDPGDPDPPDPPTGECGALTYDQTVLAVEEGVKRVLSGICAGIG